MSRGGHFSDMPALADDVGYWGRSGQVAANLFEESENSFGLWIFAPPPRPPDFMGGTSGLHDDALICGTEWLGEAGQRGLDEPWLEGHPCSLAIGIEFPRHS